MICARPTELPFGGASSFDGLELINSTIRSRSTCQRTLNSRPLRTLKSGPPHRAGGVVRGRPGFSRRDPLLLVTEDGIEVGGPERHERRDRLGGRTAKLVVVGGNE